MKKLYRRSVTVHPSPPLPPPPISDHDRLLSLLPAAILALTAALSPQDREVLAYLISGNNNYFSNTHHRGKNKSSNCDHPPCFTCDCFRCYMSYWVRWDSSPNRQLIHEIIEAFEDGLVLKNKNGHKGAKGKNGRDRRKRSGLAAEPSPAEPKRPVPSPAKNEPGDKKEEANSSGGGGCGCGEGEGEVDLGSGGEEELEKGSVRRLVSFIGERIWGAWN